MSKEKTNTKQGGGILAGLVLLIIGVCVLWYNEGRTVKTASAIKEAKKNYTDVSSEKIDKKYEGKLVATKGKIDLSEATELTDEKFGITAKAAKLERIVEMYQWEEKCETDDNDKKKCTYEKVWNDNLIDSSEFVESGHTNPDSMPYESETYTAENAKLGKFILPVELLERLSTNKKIQKYRVENVSIFNPVIALFCLKTLYLSHNNISHRHLVATIIICSCIC